MMSFFLLAAPCLLVITCEIKQVDFKWLTMCNDIVFNIEIRVKVL